MKKWGILLGIVAIISIISEVVAESKRLEEPIVLEVVLDFNMNQIYVAYLTNTIEPARIEWIEIDGNSYLPRSGGFDMFGGGEIQPSSYMDARYYSIYDAAMIIHDVQREELLADAESLAQVKIHFKGQEEALEADMLVVEPSTSVGIRANGWERGEGKMTMSIIAEEELTLTDIKLVNTFGKMKAILKDDTPLSLPVTLQKGEVLHAELEEIVGVYAWQQAYLRLSGNAGGDAFNEIRGSIINHSPTSEWVKERVENYFE